MPALRELQQDFTRAVLHGEIAVLEWIKPNGLGHEQRLAVYRNNTFLGLAEALKDGYPVVCRLVGEGFFKQMAKRYITHHPPHAGYLLAYGDNFPNFVADYPPLQGLPYLADMAKLEWLWQKAFHEADAGTLNLSALASVPPERQSELRFRLHPSARFLASDYPLLRIWETNQPGFIGDGQINLDEGGCRLLVFRPGLEVDIHALDNGDYALLNALAEDLTLAKAVQQALLKDAGFDLPASLRRWISKGLLTCFIYN